MTDTPTPDKIPDLFFTAAKNESIDSPGVDGLVEILQSGLAGYIITAEDVSAVYKILGFQFDCSFTSATFAQLVIQLFADDPVEIQAPAADVTKADTVLAAAESFEILSRSRLLQQKCLRLTRLWLQLALLPRRCMLTAAGMVRSR